jgi:hypothetical protein
MKTLRVTLADIIGPTGTPNSTATVHARYVDTSGRGRDVHLTDGTIVVPVRRVASPDGDPEVFDFDVYANDAAPVREVDYGHLVEVSWTVVAPTGAKSSGVKRVQITDSMASVVQLGLLATPTPVPPYTGGYVLPGELDALDARVVVLEEAPGGGGGGAVDSVNGETGVVVLDAADVGAATAAQGALADTAVQPAALAAYATDTELANGLATKANTSHTHTSANVTDFTEAVQDALAAAWGTAGGGPAFPFGNTGGDTAYHGMPGWVPVGQGAPSTAMTQYHIYSLPVFVPRAITVTGWTCFPYSGNVAGKVLRVGIYTATGENAWSGGNLLADLGTVSTATSGGKTVSGLSQELAAGQYRIGLVTDSTALTLYGLHCANQAMRMRASLGTNSLSANISQWTGYGSSPDHAVIGMPATLTGMQGQSWAFETPALPPILPLTLAWSI